MIRMTSFFFLRLSLSNRELIKPKKEKRNDKTVKSNKEQRSNAKDQTSYRSRRLSEKLNEYGSMEVIKGLLSTRLQV